MYIRESIGLNEAKAALDAILTEASRDGGKPAVIAVVDDKGELICLARMDGANPFHQTMAVRKATTAALMGLDTSVFGQMMPKMNMTMLDFGSTDICLVPGGLTVRKPGGGAVLGGIGVSGRQPGQDEELARSGLAVIGVK